MPKNFETFGGNHMGKICTIQEAVENFVHSGDTICFGGFTTNRKPYAAVSEILRQGQKDFTVWAGPAGGDWDMLIGAGRVRAFINCYTANSGYTNVSRRFRAWIEEGKLIYEDYSQDVLMLQLHAASLGLPFLPVRLMGGSGLTEFWGISREERKTLPTVDDLKLAFVDNPFNPGEKVVAVPVPKLDCSIIHVQKASPDGTCVIEGDEFHDVDIAVAAKRTIVTCEELVSDEYIRRDPTQNKIFGQCVNAVVHAPHGAWPSQCYGYYDVDGAAMVEYDQASKKQETFEAYLDKWVYSVKNHEELLDKVGASRLIGTKNVPGLGYAGKIQ
jgi:glutaconate CoA-transferase subunit A